MTLVDTGMEYILSGVGTLTRWLNCTDIMELKEPYWLWLLTSNLLKADTQSFSSDHLVRWMHCTYLISSPSNFNTPLSSLQEPQEASNSWVMIVINASIIRCAIPSLLTVCLLGSRTQYYCSWFVCHHMGIIFFPSVPWNCFCVFLLSSSCLHPSCPFYCSPPHVPVYPHIGGPYCEVGLYCWPYNVKLQSPQ